MKRPLANSYWVVPGRLLAGEYPLGRRTVAAGPARLRALAEAGINLFIDLTEAGECADYASLLPPGVIHQRVAWRDASVPRSTEAMSTLQRRIFDALAAGHNLYVHCRAGIGRTGTAVGCYLVEQGYEGEAALAELNRLWQQSARCATWPELPQTPQQADYIRGWRASGFGATPALEQADAAASAAAPGADACPSEDAATLAVVRGHRQRFHGALLGLALGDAAAATTQLRRAGSFAPLRDLIGGGPYDLPRGAWSDDTALCLCQAESLVECAGFNGEDLLQRWRSWQQQGHLSATGQCSGITAGMARLLAGTHGDGDAAADADLLLRAVAPALYLHGDALAAARAMESALLLSHANVAVVETCRLYLAMLQQALRGAPLQSILKPPAAAFAGQPPSAALLKRLQSDPLDAHRNANPARHTLAQAVDAVRWALAGASKWRECVLRAANLGGSSDVIAAAAGALAGAYWRAPALPSGWLSVLARQELIGELADRLLASALVRLGEEAAGGGGVQA
ncbi:MAG: ADP-ribosylglycohydrolase family protein [Steroidobacteraceae bacterium]